MSERDAGARRRRQTLSGGVLLLALGLVCRGWRCGPEPALNAHLPRTFLNVANQAFYDRLAQQLVTRDRTSLRAIPAGSAHVTYAFVGEFADDALDRLAALTSAVAERHHVFEIELATPGVLRGGARPRLVCAKLRRGADEVRVLTAELSSAVQPIAPGVRPSRAPHVTLASFRKNATRHDGDQVAQTLARAEGRADRVSLIQIVESVLTQRGPVYSVKAGLPLGGHR